MAEGFDSCRFDFRLDSKNGLTPSKRKRARRNNQCYNTLFKCKICGSLFDNRTELLEHKMIHNEYRCPICDVKVARKATLKEHLTVVHVLGKGSMPDCDKAVPDGRAMQLSLKDHIKVVRGMVNKKGRGGKTPSQSKAADQTPLQAPPSSAEASMAQSNSGMVCINVPIFIGNGAQGSSATGVSMSVNNSSAPSSEGILDNVSSAPQNVLLPFPVDVMGQTSTTVTPSVDDPIVAMPTVASPAFPLPETNPSVSSKGGTAEEDLEPGEIRRRPKKPTQDPPKVPTPPAPERAEATPPPPPADPAPAPATTATAATAPAPAPAAPLPPNIMLINNIPMIALQCQDGTVRLFPLQATGTAPAPKVKEEPAEPPTTHVNTLPTCTLPYTNEQDTAINVDEPQDLTVRGSSLSNSPHPPSRYSVTAGSVLFNPPPTDEEVIDLSMKGPHSSNSSVRPSPSATPTGSEHKGRKKSGLDRMVAKLWQTKIQAHVDEEPKDIVTPPYVHSPPPEPQKYDFPPDDIQIGVNLEPFNFVHNIQPIDDPELYHIPTLPEPMIPAPVQKPVPATQSSGRKRRADGQPKPFKFHTVKFHTCKICKQLCDSPEKLWEHSFQHEQEMAQWSCTMCVFRALSAEDLLAHCQQVHGDQHTAETENAVTDSNPGSPTQEFVCTYCRQSFSQASELEAHVLFHLPRTNENEPANCEYQGCGLIFTNRRDLWQHVEKEHFKRFYQKNIPCPVAGCSRRFASVNHLKRHMVVHSDERPIECPTPGCGKTFKELKNLRKHQLVHIGGKVYQCTMCDYSCHQAHLLLLHIKERHWANGKLTEELVDEAVLPVDITEDSNNATNVAGYDSGDQMVDDDCLITESSLGDMLPVNILPETNANIGTDASKESTDDVVEVTPDVCSDQGHNISEPEDDSSVNLSNEMIFAAQMQLMPTDSSMMISSSTVNEPVPIDGKYHICNICQLIFESAEKMWAHRLLAHDDAKLYCEQCPFHTEDPLELENHVRTEHSFDGECKEHVCSLCDKAFSTQHSLNVHMVKHSTAETSVPFGNDPTESRSDTKAAIRAHLKRNHKQGHGPSVSCPFEDCARAEDSSESTNNNNDEDRLLFCDHPGCDKTFREAKHLKVHRMLHTDERPLKCEFDNCDYSCRQRNSMNWHMKSKHNMQKHVTPDGRTIYV